MSRRASAKARRKASLGSAATAPRLRCVRSPVSLAGCCSPRPLAMGDILTAPLQRAIRKAHGPAQYLARRTCILDSGMSGKITGNEPTVAVSVTPTLEAAASPASLPSASTPGRHVFAGRYEILGLVGS